MLPVNAPLPAKTNGEAVVAVSFVTEKVAALSSSAAIVNEPCATDTSPAVTVNTVEPLLPAIVVAPYLITLKTELDPL